MQTTEIGVSCPWDKAPALDSFCCVAMRPSLRVDRPRGWCPQRDVRSPDPGADRETLLLQVQSSEQFTWPLTLPKPPLSSLGPFGKPNECCGMLRLLWYGSALEGLGRVPDPGDPSAHA